MIRHPLLFVLLSLFALSTTAQEITPPYDFDWQLLKQGRGEKGVTIHIYDVPNKDLHAFKGSSHVDYSPLQIVAMMMDLEAMPEWVYQLRSIDKQTDVPKPKHFYMAFKRIWPVKARDVGVEGFIRYEPDTKVVHLYSHNNEEYFPPRKGFVRIKKLYSHWTLTPVESGGTRVELESFADMGGRLPSWIVNMAAKGAPQKTFDGLRKQLETGKYNIQSIDELPFVPEGLEGY